MFEKKQRRRSKLLQALYLCTKRDEYAFGNGRSPRTSHGILGLTSTISGNTKSCLYIVALVAKSYRQLQLTKQTTPDGKPRQFSHILLFRFVVHQSYHPIH